MKAEQTPEMKVWRKQRREDAEQERIQMKQAQEQREKDMDELGRGDTTKIKLPPKPPEKYEGEYTAIPQEERVIHRAPDGSVLTESQPGVRRVLIPEPNRPLGTPERFRPATNEEFLRFRDPNETQTIPVTNLVPSPIPTSPRTIPPVNINNDALKPPENQKDLPRMNEVPRPLATPLPVKPASPEVRNQG